VRRARLESAFSALFAIFTLLTAVWPSWIEGLTGLEPDGGNGTLEWLILFVFGVSALVLGLLARHDYLLARPQPTSNASPR
jgi:hypothetical protein